jgi:uncharacterized membrane protein YhaH (DUF805 family)
MLSSPIGRLRFFLYSIAISITELIAVLLCVAGTMGFDGFIHSKPGPSRERLALACFVLMMVFAVARMIITWRRRNDADLSKWLVVPYMVFLPLFAALQAATLLIYDVNTGNSNIGLNILSITLLAVWFRICFASSKEKPFDPDVFLAAEGFGEGPNGKFGLAATGRIPAGASTISTPVRASARGHGNAGGITFGKRGRG